MKASTFRFTRSGWLALLLAALASTNPSHPVGAQAPSMANGQTVTPLGDGRELVLGGVGGGRVQGEAWVRDARTNRLISIRGLSEPRAWHTATLLPDGSVLVLGGIDESGQPVRSVERFDVTGGTAEEMPGLSWKARSAHSATLIDSNHIVLAGGIVDGEVVGDVEVLDLEAWQVTTVGSMGLARAYHSARLLADGRTEIWGGTGPDPIVATSGAIVDGSQVRDVFAREQDDSLLWLTASDPQDGSIVAVPQTIMLRLSRPAREDSLTRRAVILSAGGAEIAARVISAEGGRLVFLTPNAPLELNTSYVVTVNGARDTTGTLFPLLSITFSTSDATGGAGSSVDDEVWDPRVDPMGARIRNADNESRWRSLPPLKAANGVTAVSGQVLRLNGLPLAGVEMELEDHPARTDATGRFLLAARDISTGWHTLEIDGKATRGNNANYGKYEVAVWITSGKTAVLPYTVWLPKIDSAHAIRIASPATSETVITTPLIPGLELQIPAGAVITDENGRAVREISITPIPVNQPPFPLAANVNVPIYFTIQPGGAYVAVSGSSGYAGARVIYPNRAGHPPGTVTEFWHYEPKAGRGWYVYGRGAVTADGRQIAPDRGVAIREFTGAMVGPVALGGGPGAAPGDPGKGGDPVHLGTGVFVHEKTDLTLPDVLPIGITRTYRSLDTIVRAFGIGATHQFDSFLVGTTFPYTYIDLVLPNGSRVHFPRISPGTGYADAVYEHTSSPTGYFKARISWNGNGWNLDLKDGSRMVFREGFNAIRPSFSAVTRIQDRYGNAIVLTRNADADLTRITSPNGRWIELTYDTTHRVTQASDNGGRSVGYTYDASGRLWKVTGPAGGITEYTYDTSHRMLTLKDPRGITFLTNQYDANGRVDLQTQADGTTFRFAYTLDAQGRVEQTDLTNPRGYVRRVTYDPASGYLLTDTAAYGTSLARTTTLMRDAATNFVTRITDGLARNTDYGYDTFGNMTSVTRLAGTVDALTTSYTYDSTFNQLASLTDPLNHTTTIARDSLGSVTAITDALGHQTSFTSAASGLALTVTTAAGTTTFTYDGADLVGITDPIGRTTTRFVDSLGRRVRTTNPLGQTTTYTYDALNAITQSIDGLGATTVFTYDANQNLLTLTDALNHTTTYTYNNMDQLATRADPLFRQELFTSDSNGNVSQHTDRKGQITSSTYDALDRLITVTYHDASTTTYTYDIGDRVTQILDSVAGSITRTWDLLDRMTSETTPEGSITYTYDTAGRRTTMTVAGQPQVSYSYDDANRLTSITQNGSTVSLMYDNANRRTALTLPNGVTTEYGYDAASQLTALTYRLGQTTLGTLSYGYDLAGNRTSVGGSWAAIGLPATLTSATYDASNQIATWGGALPTYDPNGNLTSDGVRTYTWNARNQLTAISGPVNASFGYDGVGRRRTKTVASATTNFLYDRANSVQELSSGSPVANTLTGLAVDEYFTRTDAAGARNYLLDALGSSVALTDASGTVQTEYTYEPFGNLTTSGATTSNPFAFTGREADGTGLYFYRARYYDPAGGRFISEDPIGFEGGINFYGYALNSPTNLRDPSGRSAGTVAIGLGGLICFGSGVCETIIVGTGVAVTVAATTYLVRNWFESRAHSDPIPYPGTRNPGPCDKDPGKCKPCPPDSPYWDQPGNVHGGTTGVHYHWWHWNQKPYPDCTCYPTRLDGGTPPTGGTPWSPGGAPWP